MIAKIVAAVVKIFSKTKPGVLLQILAVKAGSVIASEILDPQNQKKAYEFVKELHLRKDLDNSMKAKVFNKKMAEWFMMAGKKASDSVVNCLRELAVNAFKCESEEENNKQQ